MLLYSEIEIRDYYTLFDRKGDGKIDKKQVGDVARALGLNPTNQEINSLMASCQDERLTFEQFYPMCTTLEKQEQARTDGKEVDRLIDGFRAFDREQNGLIGFTDVQNIVEKLGEKLSRAESDQILAPLVDSDGKIAYEKMIKSIIEVDKD